MELFAHVKGVCDTPLHIYHLFAGERSKYAMREYPQKEKNFAKNCRGVSHTPSMAAKMKIGSASIRAKGHDAIVRSREGRMRYAPTYLPIVRRGSLLVCHARISPLRKEFRRKL